MWLGLSFRIWFWTNFNRPSGSISDFFFFFVIVTDNAWGIHASEWVEMLFEGAFLFSMPVTRYFSNLNRSTNVSIDISWIRTIHKRRQLFFPVCWDPFPHAMSTVFYYNLSVTLIAISTPSTSKLPTSFMDGPIGMFRKEITTLYAVCAWMDPEKAHEP